MFEPNGLLSSNSGPSLGLPSLLVDNGDLDVFVDGPSLTRPTATVEARGFDGRRISYLRRRRPIDNNETTSSVSSTTFLSVPIHRLLDNARRELATKRQLKSSTVKPLATSAITQDQLWVDRYKPTRFTDLLGDERVHRETMAWVKQWDFCVFGANKRRKWQRDEFDIPNPDELKRPREKILLLSGPPGLGKTTLAHVVARQAGYNVLEINGSDARTGQVIDDRIRPALEAGSAIGSSKPVLVVIDEVDGATGGAGENSSHFIQRLISLVADRPAKKGRAGKQSTGHQLRRPIICICNDLYAASLARLRPIARIVRFQKATDIHLVRRLRDICELEGMKSDTRSLSTLVGVAQGDLRSCINALQFVKLREEPLTEEAVRRATVGLKEAETSFMATLTDLFTVLPKRRVKELGLSESEEARFVSRLSRAVEASGTIDKIVNGCFEQYIITHQQDANLQRFDKATEWLCSFDLLSGAMRTEREYALIPYTAFPAVAFFPLFAQRGAQKLERPKADWENYLKTKQHEEIFKSLTRCLQGEGAGRTGEYRHMLSNGVLQLEFAPLINRIISPPLRPVNSQVIRADEKKLLSRLVEIMVALDLRFLQEKTEDGNLVYRLDPPVDVFITYDGKRASDIAVSRYAVRHLVASEIDELSIQRTARASESQLRRSGPNLGTGDAWNEDPAHAEGTDGASVDSGQLLTKQRAEGGKVSQIKPSILEKGPVDFFGRPIVPVANRKNQSALEVAPSKRPRVTYRFNEGNSAAVRKPVKITDLM